MIDFRYHLVSIIAIFFALAAGIVLGAGPLSETIDDTLTEQTSQLREENRRLHEQLDSAAEENAYQEVFLQEVTPRLVSDQLDGARVAIIAMPGADDELIGAVREGMERSGAQAELTVRIQPSWTDPDSEPVLDQLATELVSTGTELGAGNGFDRGATVLASALLSEPAENGMPDEAADTVNTTVVTAFEEADLVQLEQDTSTAPSLAVIVAGAVSGDDGEERLARLVTLMGQLRGASGGVVLAGPLSSVDGGLIGALRGSDVAEQVSSVDVADQPSGRVAIVFALTEQQRGEAGHYGIGGGSDSALPPVPDTAAPTDETDGTDEGGDAGDGDPGDGDPGDGDPGDGDQGDGDTGDEGGDE
ncbi:copper transporter [Phytoactinopolyspora alkaliphila]|uniref:Copper transporter n=1 Tax=Phytoactinopolyspora alkaliphila TaxID=1783498 RepID=A0A6N9YTM8_9ACTN|nr:copper transporter [Phytoactinopolyspora alkaliphila]